MLFDFDNNGFKQFEVVFTPERIKMKFHSGDISLILHPQAFQKISQHRLEISNKLIDILGGESSNLKLKLFHDVYLTVQFPYECVQIRRFNREFGLLYPTNDGISLNPLQWVKFLDVIKELETSHPIFTSVNICPLLHQNQEDQDNCYNCHADSEEEEEEEEDLIEQDKENINPAEFFH